MGDRCGGSFLLAVSPNPLHKSAILKKRTPNSGRHKAKQKKYSISEKISISSIIFSCNLIKVQYLGVRYCKSSLEDVANKIR